MDRKNRLSTFLRNGLYNGATAGCMSSLGFIILATIIFGITIRSFDLSIAIFILAISFGFFPVILIACLFGLISGLVYYLLQGQITNAKRSRILSLLLSLGIATSAITIWSSFLLNGFKVEGLQFSWEMYLFFMPFCIVGGLYVGKKLNQLIINSDYFDAKDISIYESFERE